MPLTYQTFPTFGGLGQESSTYTISVRAVGFNIVLHPPLLTPANTHSTPPMNSAVTSSLVLNECLAIRSTQAEMMRGLCIVSQYMAHRRLGIDYGMDYQSRKHGLMSKLVGQKWLMLDQPQERPYSGQAPRQGCRGEGPSASLWLEINSSSTQAGVFRCSALVPPPSRPEDCRAIDRICHNRHPNHCAQHSWSGQCCHHRDIFQTVHLVPFLSHHIPSVTTYVHLAASPQPAAASDLPSRSPSTPSHGRSWEDATASTPTACKSPKRTAQAHAGCAESHGRGRQHLVLRRLESSWLPPLFIHRVTHT